MTGKPGRIGMKARISWIPAAAVVLLLAVAVAGCVATQPAVDVGAALPSGGAISPRQASDLIVTRHDDPGFVLLDIRTPDEVDASHISGAVSLDFYSPEFENDLAALDRDVVYLIYCRTGHRSGLAYDMMEELGFQHVYDLDGGITEWMADGYPVCEGALSTEHTCIGDWTPSSPTSAL
jgi:rhodanese-related sulfurtransferase